MISIEYANAYTEILEIIKFIPDSDYEKIPTDYIQNFQKNSNTNYCFKYNPKKSLDEQNVSKRAKAIIAIIFKDYWATDIQREKIIAKQNYDRMQLEKEKQARYSSNEIFKNKKIENIGNSTETYTMIKYKETFIDKIIKKIKKIFKK